MFLNRSDRLLIMDDLYNRFEPDEFRLLAEAGVKVIYPQGAIRWRDFQPEADKPFDFDWLDRYTDAVRAHGLKILMPFVHSLPDWCPPEWYHSREGRGKTKNIFRYDCAEAGAFWDEMALKIIERYGGPDFQLIYAYPADGEFPTHFWPTSPDIEYPILDFCKWVYNRQIILKTQHGEVWTAYHPYTQPTWWKALYDTIAINFQFCDKYHICFTYFPHEHSAPWVKQYIGGLSTNIHECFVGSEYCTGLRENMDTLKQRALRGFLTSPIHFSQGYPRLDKERIETIVWALEELSRD